MPQSNGHSYILVVVDSFSGMVFFCALRSKSANSVVEAIKDLFFLVGFPVEVQSDNGSEFISERVCHFLDGYGVAQRFSAPYNSHANGLVERHVGLVKESLKKN